MAAAFTRGFSILLGTGGLTVFAPCLISYDYLFRTPCMSCDKRWHNLLIKCLITFRREVTFTVLVRFDKTRLNRTVMAQLIFSDIRTILEQKLAAYISKCFQLLGLCPHDHHQGLAPGPHWSRHERECSDYFFVFSST